MPVMFCFAACCRRFNEERRASFDTIACMCDVMDVAGSWTGLSQCTFRTRRASTEER